MIDVKAAKKLILSEIAGLTTKDGFHAKPAEQAFYLPKPFGRWIVHVGFIPHRNVDVDITVDIAIRIDAVEMLVNERRDDLGARESGLTATLGGDIGNLNDGKQRRWTLASSEQAAAIAASIHSEIRSIGWAFFERYSDFGNVLKVLTSSDARDWRLAPGHVARCNRAVALAFVLGKAQDTDTVTQACEKLISEKDSSVLPEFSSFVDSLRARMCRGELPRLT